MSALSEPPAVEHSNIFLPSVDRFRGRIHMAAMAASFGPFLGQRLWLDD